MPKIYKDQLPPPPSNHSELITHPFKDQFIEAMDKALKKNKHQEVWKRDTYAATLAFKILRFLLAIICAFDLEMRQYDVVNAFPHVPLDEEVYCSPPKGMNIALGLVLLLLRALYGLKQSPAL
ncbi:Reverse transcriptase RNA-dependent DNA polymerase [Neofusicoccum parvum]|nr:Reverse transcriptase RNA-dependent DNA polymerase [Neofusicoccum parvum]